MTRLRPRRLRPRHESPRIRNAIETRAVEVMTLEQDPEQILEQITVPRHHVTADLALSFGAEVPPQWGPLCGWLASQAVVIEIVGERLTVEAYNRYCAESLLLANRWKRPTDARLLIVCRFRPDAVLRTLAGDLLHAGLPGLWQMALPSGGSGHLLVPQLLPAAPGHSLLRLIFGSDDPDETARRFRALEEDPIISTSVKDAFKRSIDMQQLPTTDAERSIGFLAAAQAARQEGRIEGRNEGQHQALLAVALDLFGPDGVAGLDAIADPDELRAEIRRRAQVKLAR
jgi:hypothetical protein